MDKKRRGRPNRRGGRGGRGRGRGNERGKPVVRGSGGWSSSRKGGLDLDDSLDGPCVNDPSYGHNRRDSASNYTFTGTRSTRGRGSAPKVHLELQQLFMSSENQELVRKTLQSLRTEDIDEASGDEEDVEEDDYDELDVRDDDQYWTTDYNQPTHPRLLNRKEWLHLTQDTTVVQALLPETMFKIKKLQRCGFSLELCEEALQICDEDVGAAMEYLLNDFFDIRLSIKDTEATDTGSDLYREVLEAREDEKMALKSIYDEAFEERIMGKVWALNLELQELTNLLKQKQTLQTCVKKTEDKNTDRKVCPFYRKGNCRFGDRCHYSHEISVIDKPQNLTHPIYANLRALEEHKCPFSIEIRFPDGSLYPHEPPLLVFSSELEELPPYTRLNITKFLMQQAKEFAESKLPCIFSLISALEQTEQLQELLSLPPPRMVKPLPLVEPVKSKTTFQQKDKKGPQDWPTDEDKLKQQRVPENVPSKEAGDSQAAALQRRHDPVPYRVNPVELRRQNKLLHDEFLHTKVSKQYRNMQADRHRLPAWDMKDLILEVVAQNPVIVISGITGCGKTTQVPQFLLDEALLTSDFKANIVCTQPRRLSAMAVAQRVADERTEKLGRCVGYQIRLESVMSQFTRLLFCTTGIILRRLEKDTMLDGVTHIIIDEVHERSEESDFLLMILKDILNQRPDLKVILMSATMNAKLFSDYFGGCPVLEIPGCTYPVQQYFLEDVIEFTQYQLEEKSPYARPLKHGKRDVKHGRDIMPDYLDDELEMDKGHCLPARDKMADMSLSVAQMQTRYAVYSTSTIKTLSHLDLEKINYDLIVLLLEYIVTSQELPSDGAILVFMPGFAEIQTLYDMLLSTSTFRISNKSRYKIIPLHSTLSSEDQNAVFVKPKEGIRKIVIATNIAETSITIDDIVFVVDTGKMKEKRFDQTKSMESLDSVWVSRANAMQRKGRAGRVQEGVCFHLFTSHHFKHHLREQPIPEVQRACLEQLVLKIKMLPLFNEQPVQTVLEKLIEAPSLEAIQGAVKRLTDLGALDDNADLTPLGYHVGSLPVDVRIGKLMLFGAIFRCLDSTLTIAATLSFKSPFVSPFGLKQESDEKRKEFAVGNSDYLTMLNAYKGWCEAKLKGSHQAYLYCQENFLSIKTLQMLASLKQQYVELLSDIGFIQQDIQLQDVERAARGGTDGVAQITGIEANVNSNNLKLLSALLVAALYPNILQVLTPETRYHPSSSGAVVKQPNPEDLKFKTKQDGYVHIHPSSVNFQARHFSSPYLVYHEKVKTTKVYIRDCSMVSVYPLLLFGGGGISMDIYQGHFILSIDDGWIQFKASSTQVAELVRDLRYELDQLLSDKISQPDMDLLTCPRGSKIISCIVELISSQ
ncbi:ATP-dependent RNA helicase DHX57 [Biomphalaria glabrata]|nr:ATP-dependent RNA helicase DHX57 [Biomphalaria glabrata]